MANSHGSLRDTLEYLQRPNLSGNYEAAPTPAFSPAKLLSGAWQREVEDWWTSRMPLRNHSVRAVNQVYYSVFRKSYVLRGRILIEGGENLSRVDQTANYCNWQRVPPGAVDMRRWAREIRQLQDHFTARGKTFIYLIAAVKAVSRRGELPAGIPCSENIDWQRRTLLPLLREAGVRTVDGVPIIQAAMNRYPVADLYPPGDFHWSEIGATEVLRETVAAMGSWKHQPLILPPFQYDRYPADAAHLDYVQAANQLSGILNLLVPRPTYLPPRVKFTTPQGLDTTRQPRVAIVGDSFLDAPADILARSGLVVRIDEYFYFGQEHRRFEPGRPPKRNFAPTPDSFQAIEDADIVILEENQSGLSNNQYVRDLRNHLRLPPLRP